MAQDPRLVDLVRATLAGDKQAREEMYERLRRPVSSLARDWAHYIKNSGKGSIYSEQDLEQDAWEYLFSGIRTANRRHLASQATSPLEKWLEKQEIPFNHYIGASIRNYFIDHYRNVQRGSDLEAISESENYYDDMPALSLDEQVTLQDCIKYCWAKLDPRDQQLLMWKNTLDLSHAEIAKKFLVSEASISRWLNKAKAKLHKLLKDEGLDV